jgi:hypothetical protein
LSLTRNSSTRSRSCGGSALISAITSAALIALV